MSHKATKKGRLGNNPLSFIRSTSPEEETAENVKNFVPKPTSEVEDPPTPKAEAVKLTPVEALPASKPTPEPENKQPQAPKAKAAPKKAAKAPTKKAAPKAEDENLDPMLVEFPKPAPEEVPKYLTFEEKISVLFSAEQVEYLTQLERVIMRSRSRPNKKERITKNTILRAMVDTYMEKLFEYKEISDEAELRNRLRRAIPRSEA